MKKNLCPKCGKVGRVKSEGYEIQERLLLVIATKTTYVCKHCKKANGKPTTWLK